MLQSNAASSPRLVLAPLPPIQRVDGAHPHHRGLITYVLPRPDVAPGVEVIHKPVDPANKDMVEKLNKLLRSRIRFRLRIQMIWVKVADKRLNLDANELPEFLDRVADKLGVPRAIFDNLAYSFLYDFDGNGLFAFKEAYKLVRDKLGNYRKSLGGHPEIDVPTKTPQEAGYRMVKVLASGGQGTANLAEDASGESKVLKVYDKANANAASLDDLKEEMEHMKKAEHLHVAVCHEIFQDTGHLYMVSDPYMGGDLDTLQVKALAAGVELSENWYRHIFKQAFVGLDYLHKNCVVHCDIKEPNLMVKEPQYHRPDIVIIDLGLAGALAPARGACGTPGYMPPETWENGAWYPRGDVFSMGVVIVQMLTDNIPNAKLGKGGIFQKGRTIQEISLCTKCLEPPFDDMDPYIENAVDGGDGWLAKILEKDFRNRLNPAEVLNHSWFQVPFLERCSEGLSQFCPWGGMCAGPLKLPDYLPLSQRSSSSDD